jgi:small subunit ribosomal protein S15
MLKEEIIKGFRTHENDTGSPEVQIALLTTRITQIAEHLKLHKKDFAAKRGLLILIAQRNSFLKYLFKRNKESYKAICEKLAIRSKLA